MKYLLFFCVCVKLIYLTTKLSDTLVTLRNSDEENINIWCTTTRAIKPAQPLPPITILALQPSDNNCDTCKPNIFI